MNESVPPFNHAPAKDAYDDMAHARSDGDIKKFTDNIERVIEFGGQDFSDEEVNSLSEKEIMFRMGQIEWAFTAKDFILSFSLPNFYFHVTTLYDLFRVKGLEIGKLDFAGALRIKN